MKLLYHYTSLDSCKNILEAESLHLTHYEDFLDKEDCKVLKNDNKVRYDILNGYSPFIISLCKNGCSDYCWKNYADDGGGVVFEFDVSQLKKEISPKWQKKKDCSDNEIKYLTTVVPSYYQEVSDKYPHCFALFEVAYDEAGKRTDEFKENMKNNPHPHLSVSANTQELAGMHIKRVKYKEEEEVRLVAIGHCVKPQEETHFVPMIVHTSYDWNTAARYKIELREEDDRQKDIFSNIVAENIISFPILLKKRNNNMVLSVFDRDKKVWQSSQEFPYEDMPHEIQQEFKVLSVVAHVSKKSCNFNDLSVERSRGFPITSNNSDIEKYLEKTTGLSLMPQNFWRDYQENNPQELSHYFGRPFFIPVKKIGGNKRFVRVRFPWAAVTKITLGNNLGEQEQKAIQAILDRKKYYNIQLLTA